MKNIFITGSSGFIGENFVTYLYSNFKSYNIICIDKNLPTINLNAKIHFIKGDIKNLDLMTNIINDYDFEFIIHFAAQTHVDDSFNNSIEYSMDNIIGTQIILECIKNKKDPNLKLIHISTDEVYGDDYTNNTKKTEKCLLVPTNPYSASKAAAEMLINSYICSFNLKVVIIRMNNVYGHKQTLDKVIPKFINQVKNKTYITIHGDGSNKRSFIHVNDVCRAFIIIMQKGNLGEIYNIASNNEISILELAKTICSNLNYPESNIKFVEDRIYNDKRYYIDDSKIKELGFQPRISFYKGLSDTIKYYINLKDTDNDIQ